MSEQPTLSRDEQMEQENEAFLAVERESKLRTSANGDQRCDNCRYLAGVHKQIGYCDHPRLQLLVGIGWWCQWWEAAEG